MGDVSGGILLVLCVLALGMIEPWQRYVVLGAMLGIIAVIYLWQRWKEWKWGR